MVEDFPLTCAWCKHGPATHVLIYDPGWRSAKSDRITVLICGPCAEGNAGRAGAIAKSPASAWLFILTPVGRATVVSP